MSHKHPALPYAIDALAPHISAETLEYHHGKHHAGYVKKLNAAIEGTELAGRSLEALITSTEGGVFNNAAQHFNHSFYWKSLSPNGGGQPSGALADAITSTWGSFDAFKDALTAAAGTHFGSGWAWLVKDAEGKLSVMGTHDADTPLAHGFTPILTIDVWEHAYYIDYRNARPSYIAAFWELVNWDFASANFAG